MDVYLDLVILLNFLVDFLLLWGTDKLCGASASLKRTALAAGLGAAYGGFCLLPGFVFLGGPLWRLVSFAAMGVLAFGLSISAVRRSIVFFLLSMALGGLAMGLGKGSLWTIALAAAALWAMCCLGFDGKTYVPVTVKYKGRRMKLTALVDTGNTLRDPVSGRPVLVVQEKVGQQLLGLTEQQLRSPLDTLSSGLVPGLRLVPYHAVGVADGLLLAVQPEEVELNGKRTAHLVAFAPNMLGDGSRFDALAGGML